MAAFLVYDRVWKKHTDTSTIMTLTDPNMANSSLFMINVDVNAKSIKYQLNSNKYAAEYDEMMLQKYMCFHDGALSCAESNRNKHLIIKPGTIVLSIPPGASMSAHHPRGLFFHK